MKIFHVVSNPSVGGIEGMLSNLIPVCDSEKYDIRAVNMRDHSTAYALWDSKGVRYHTLPTPNKLYVSSIYRLYRLLKAERPDVVEIYGLRANFVGRIAARLAGVPVIITGVLNTDDWRKWYHVWIDRSTARCVTAWIPNSKACAESLIRRERFPAEKIYTMYDGINVDNWSLSGEPSRRVSTRRALGLGDCHILMATVGNLRHQKGYPYLIEAVPGIIERFPDARFLFVGRGPMEDALKARCRELGIDNVVIFAGYRSDIKDLYEASDVALLPSLYEGLPISLIEAMAMELPVISTKVSGIPELVVDGRTGLLIDPADSTQIVEAVNALLADDDRRKRMGAAGRQRVVDTFNLFRMRDELFAFYEQKLNETKSE